MVYNQQNQYTITAEMEAASLVIEILRQIFGLSEKIATTYISASEKGKLSFSLQHRYQYLVAEVGSVSLILAIDCLQQDQALSTPRAYLSDYRELERIFAQPVAFLLPERANVAYCRRLVRAQIPFLSRHGEIYVPRLMLKLQQPDENRTSFRPAPAKLSPSTQVVLLRQFLFGDIAGLNLRQTARLLQYTPMGIYKAKEELVAYGLCEYKGTRRASSFSFPPPSHELWEKALLVMKTPVKEERYVRWESNVDHFFLLAGVTALSRHTLIADDRLPTIAAYRYAEEVKNLPAVHEEEASAILQLWSYDPRKLVNIPFSSVDLLSLYLSLKDDLDERIKQELRKIPLP
ncbi:MAG: hypothetical protein RSE01_01580 [Akkermansia sp.]